MFKQKFIFSSIFMMLLTVVVAQESVNQLDSDGKRHGLWTKNYDNTDLVRYKGVFEHGKEIDTFSYYKISNGKSVLSAIRVFNKNNNRAEVKFYTSNGKVVSEGKMDGKDFIGQWVYYHRNSDKKMIVENYNDVGQLEGERKVFYENGVMAEHANYRKGKLEGEAKWYSDKSVLIKVANFKNGEFHGPYKTFDNQGNITTEGNYDEDKKTGTWTYVEDGVTKTVDY
ncbi:toxin-antitoxin system YwqK family antitoxin [Winogradskyella ursingii]|uniref:toxin-antitoxin system YwqK family antitoxin n=1 Tax=Winogradskyella ursingii TaxID=2686079 RepID=UPI0015C73718|nr:toxin-antitoxin system YwqK family antitoxin [Winogradskyella ursingii]